MCPGEAFWLTPIVVRLSPLMIYPAIPTNDCSSPFRPLCTFSEDATNLHRTSLLVYKIRETVFESDDIENVRTVLAEAAL
jgi:hypothetical protein